MNVQPPSSNTRSVDFVNVLQTLITSAKLLQEATESTTLPVPSGPLLGVAIERLETIKGLKANKDLGEELAEKIVYQVSTIYHELSRPNRVNALDDDQTRECVARYTTSLTTARDALSKLTQRGVLGKSILRGKDRRELQNVAHAIDTEFNNFMTTIGKSQPSNREFRRSIHLSSSVVPELHAAPRAARASSPSPTRHESQFNTQQSQHQQIPLRSFQHCWPGTRIPILDEIDQWATSLATSAVNHQSSPSSLIYWLTDLSATGKSSIALHLADEWRERGLLGGIFDCASLTTETLRPKLKDGHDEDRMGWSVGETVTDALCESWAAQLGSEFSELTPLIMQALSELHRSRTQSASPSFHQQFTSLILQPLRQLQRAKHDLSPQTKVLFILDSLDECPREERQEILRGLKGINATHGIKVLVVSELPSSEGLSDIVAEMMENTASSSAGTPSSSIVTRGSINIHSASNMADILLYLTTRFQQHAATFHHHPQFRHTLIEPTIRVLAKRAEGIFLWAKVAFEMLINAENPTRILLNLIEEDSLGNLNGLYLECVLDAQTRLNKLQEARNAKQGDIEDQNGTYPRNSLATILSCVAYATEPLSISTLAAVSSLGFDRVTSIVRVLNVLLETSGTSSLDVVGSPPLSKRRSEELRSSSFARLPAARASTLSIPNMSSPSMPPPKSSSRRPKSANARKSSFSPAAKKRTPRPSGGGGSVPKAISPTSGSLPFSMNPDAHLSRDEMQQSHQQPMGLVPTSDPSPVSTRQEQNTKGAFSALVHIRHSTMREWICQPHPPTLLSSLMGKGAMEEDDLRFVVAPSREGGHRLLATSCLRLIKEEVSRVQGTMSKDTTLQQEQREKEVHWVVGTMESTPMMTVTDPISYSSRRWAYHSTQFLLSIDIGKRSSIYLSVASTRGSRWVELRDELIEFFSVPLLWWVDACYSRNWTSDAIGGLKQLRRVLQKYPSEEGVTPIIQEIVQWCSETIVLLEKPDALTTTSEEEGLVAFPLIWKHHSQEFLARAELKERQKAAAKAAASSYQGGPGSLLSHDHSHEEEQDELPPVPPLPDSLQGGTGSTHSAGTTGGSGVESTKATSSSSKGASSAMADEKDVPAASAGSTSSPTKAKNEAEAGQNTTQKHRQPEKTVGATEKSTVPSPGVGVSSDEGREVSNHRAHAHALATPIPAPSDPRKRNQSQPERPYGRLPGQYPGNAPDLFPAITFLQGLGKRSSTLAGTPTSPADPRSTYRHSPTTTSSPVVDMKKESGDEKAEKTNAPPSSSSKLTPQPLTSKGEPSISDMSDLLAMVNFD